MDFWYFLMSMMALVPGLYLHFLLTSPGVGGSAFLFAGAFFGFRILEVLLVGVGVGWASVESGSGASPRGLEGGQREAR